MNTRQYYHQEPIGDQSKPIPRTFIVCCAHRELTSTCHFSIGHIWNKYSKTNILNVCCINNSPSPNKSHTVLEEAPVGAFPNSIYLAFPRNRANGTPHEIPGVAWYRPPPVTPGAGGDRCSSSKVTSGNTPGRRTANSACPRTLAEHRSPCAICGRWLPDP